MLMLFRQYFLFSRCRRSKQLVAALFC
jgi:hypothetical protein